jgi:hypothetical protein
MSDDDIQTAILLNKQNKIKERNSNYRKIIVNNK